VPRAAAFEKREFAAPNADAALNACKQVAGELGFKIAESGGGRLRGEWPVRLERIHKVQLRGTSGMMNPTEDVVGSGDGVFVLEVTVKDEGKGRVSVDAKLKDPPAEYKNNGSSAGIDEEFYRPVKGEGPSDGTVKVFLDAVGRVLAGRPSGIAEKATTNVSPVNTGPGRKSGGARVAVLSVYGPENFSAGVMKKLSDREEIDRAEGEIVRQLSAGGWDVVPLAESKRLVDGEYSSTYFSLLPATVSEKWLRERQNEAKKINKPLDEYMISRANFVTRHGVASANTGLVVDYALPEVGTVATMLGTPDPVTKDVPKYSQTFLKTMGALAQKLDVDAVVVVRLIPDLQQGKEIEGEVAQAGGKKAAGTGYYATEATTVQMFNREGVQIMGRRRVGISPERIDSGLISLKFSNEKVLEGLRGATDAALSVMLAEANEKKGGR
jgi:hypothetical protein